MKNYINDKGHHIETLTRREIAVAHGQLLYKRLDVKCDECGRSSDNVYVVRCRRCYRCWLAGLSDEERKLDRNKEIIDFYAEFSAMKNVVFEFPEKIVGPVEKSQRLIEMMLLRR